MLKIWFYEVLQVVIFPTTKHIFLEKHYFSSFKLKKKFLLFGFFLKHKPKSKFQLAQQVKSFIWYFNWNAKKHQNQTDMPCHFPSKTLVQSSWQLRAIQFCKVNSLLWKQTLMPYSQFHKMKETCLKTTKVSRGGSKSHRNSGYKSVRNQPTGPVTVSINILYDSFKS